MEWSTEAAPKGRRQTAAGRRKAALARSRAAMAMAVLVAMAMAGLVAAYLWMGGKAGSVSPSPALDGPGAAGSEMVDSDGWPEVDWDYWTSVNPSVVGWISVDGTDLSQPVVQASKDDPTWWLRHDVWGNWSLYGAVYLDAECAEGGLLESRNAVVFGHNMGFGDMSMLAWFAEYSSPEFADAHRTVRLQTPAGRRLLEVRAAAVIGGLDATKRTSFDGRQDFDAWWDARTSEACTVLDSSSEGLWERGVVTVATCSYNYWSDERTVVYLADAE